MDKKALGHWGEEQAAKYLKLRAYKILDMNYSCRMGEIDLIAKRGKYIVFVEVKLRKNSVFAAAREFVNYAKQQRIITTAQLYLQEHGIELQPRFDVIEIYAPNGTEGKISIEHIEDAFM